MKFRVLFVAALCLSTGVFAGVSRSDEKKETIPVKAMEKTAPAQQKEKSLIKPEVDKTDVLAIPLDTSEEEEKEEMQTLENIQKYEKTQK